MIASHKETLFACNVINHVTDRNQLQVPSCSFSRPHLSRLRSIASVLVFQFNLLSMWIPRSLHHMLSHDRRRLCSCHLPSKANLFGLIHIQKADNFSQTTSQNHPLVPSSFCSSLLHATRVPTVAEYNRSKPSHQFRPRLYQQTLGQDQAPPSAVRLSHKATTRLQHQPPDPTNRPSHQARTRLQ